MAVGAGSATLWLGSFSCGGRVTTGESAAGSGGAAGASPGGAGAGGNAAEQDGRAPEAGGAATGPYRLIHQATLRDTGRLCRGAAGDAGDGCTVGCTTCALEGTAWHCSTAVGCDAGEPPCPAEMPWVGTPCQQKQLCGSWGPCSPVCYCDGVGWNCQASACMCPATLPDGGTWVQDWASMHCVEFGTVTAASCFYTREDPSVTNPRGTCCDCMEQSIYCSPSFAPVTLDNCYAGLL